MLLASLQPNYSISTVLKIKGKRDRIDATHTRRFQSDSLGGNEALVNLHSLSHD